MAFEKREIIDLTRILILVIVTFPWTASANVDCSGKAFHCINSTHFMICVDLGGGVSSAIDGFVIPCPSSTVCRETNRFECELLVPVMHEQVANISVPDVSELPLSTAAMRTTSATTTPQAQNDISVLSTELSQYSTDLSAINTTEQPHAPTDIGTTNITEFLQATTAYNTTEGLQTSTNISATEFLPAQTDTSAFNISQTPTEFPQVSTDFSAPNRTVVFEVQTANSVFVTTESFKVITDASEANVTELLPAIIDTSAPIFSINISQAPIEFPQAQTDISVQKRIELLQAQTPNSAYVTTEQFQVSLSISEANTAELPPATTDISAFNISQAPTEFPRVTTEITLDKTEFTQGQTAKSASVTTESLQTPTNISATELPPALTDISALNISQASTEFPQAPTAKNASVSTEHFQAATNVSIANVLEVPPALIDSSASIISQASTEFPQVTTDSSTLIKTDIFQEQTERSVFNTSESFQVVTEVTYANTTELPPALINISATNNINEINNTSVHVNTNTTTMFPQTQTNINVPSEFGITQGSTHSIALNTSITKNKVVTDNSVHSTASESLQISTDIIATSALTEMSTPIIIEHYETSTDHISAFIITKIPQSSTDISTTNKTDVIQALTDTSASNNTKLSQIPIEDSKANTTQIISQTLTNNSAPMITEIPQAPVNLSATSTIELHHAATDTSGNNKTDLLQTPTVVSTVKTTDISQTLTDVSKTNTTEQPHVPTDIDASKIIDFFQATAGITAYNTTESLQTSTGATEFPAALINTSAPTISQTLTEFLQALTDISASTRTNVLEAQTAKSVFVTTESFQASTDISEANTTELPPATIDTSLPKTTEFSQSPTDIGVPNTTEFPQATKILGPNYTIATAFKLASENQFLATDDTIVSKKTTSDSVTENSSTVSTNNVESQVISKALTDRTTFDTTQTHVSTLSYEITTEIASSTNVNQSINVSIPTRLTSEDTLTSGISPVDTDLNIKTNSVLLTTPSIVQSKVPVYSYTGQVNPNGTTFKDVMIVNTEGYKKLTQNVPTNLVGDSIIKENITITTSEPILIGLEELSTNSFKEPTSFEVNTFTELEPNKQVLNKSIEPGKISNVEHESNVNIFETLISNTINQTWTTTLGVTQSSVLTQQQFTTSLFTGNSEIRTEPTLTSNTEERLSAVTAKTTETSSGIDSYTPIQQITDSIHYLIDGTAKVTTDILPTIASQSNSNIVQQNLNINETSLYNENIVQVTNPSVETTKTSPHNTVVVTNQYSDKPMSGYIDSKVSKNEDAVTEQYSELSITNVHYSDKGLSTSDITKSVLQTNTGIEQGFVTEQYITGALNYITDVPVSTTEMSQFSSFPVPGSQQGVSKNKVLSTIDIHATLSPRALTTKLTTNMEQGVDIEHKVLQGFNKAPTEPAANVQTASQNTLTVQGGDLKTINASSSVVDNVQTFLQNTTETSVVPEPITSMSGTNLIGVNELALPVSHIILPLTIPTEQNVDTVEVLINKTDIKGVIVSNSPVDNILTAPLNNIDIEQSGHYVQNTFNDTVMSNFSADNVPFTLKNRTDIGIPRNKSEFLTISLPPANKQNAQQNHVNSSDALDAMPIYTQIILQNSTPIVDVEQDYKRTSDTDLNVFLPSVETTQTASRNSEDISVPQLLIISNNFTFITPSFNVRGRNDTDINKVPRNRNDSSATTVMDNLSQASLSKFTNVKPETIKTETNLKNEDLKWIPDLQQRSPIKDIQKSGTSASTLYSHGESIVPDKVSSASVNAAVIVNSQVTLDDNDNVREHLAGSDFLTTTKNIDDEKLNLNEAKGIGSMEGVVVQSPLLHLMQNVTRTTAIAPKIKFYKPPRISSIEFGKPGMESKSSTQSSLEKNESIQSESVTVITLSKDNSQPTKQEPQGTRTQALISEQTTGYTISPNDSDIFLDVISARNITNTKETVSELIIVPPNEQLVYSNIATINKEISGVIEPENEFTHQPPNEVKTFFESHNDDTNLSISSDIANINTDIKLNKEVDHQTVILATKHIETPTIPIITSNDEKPSVSKFRETNINDSNTSNIDKSISFLGSHNDDTNLSISSDIANINTEIKLNKEVDHRTVILATKHIEIPTIPIITSNDEKPSVSKSRKTNINDSYTSNIDKSLRSHTATNIVNSKLMPRLAHANTSLKITNNTTKIIHHHTPKNSEKHYCRNRNRGRYSDREDCSKFYICIGRLEPIIGRCPANTVFSDIKKQCTKNISHCIRDSEFECTSAGRYSDILQQNIYYICVPSGDVFVRFKFQCQNGYHLNKTSVKCNKQSELESQHKFSKSVDSKSDKSTNDDQNAKKEGRHDKETNKSVKEFKCEDEGRFGDANNCRKYYVCTKRNKKAEFRRRKKKCDSDEVFHKDKKECVDAESYEC